MCSLTFNVENSFVVSEKVFFFPDLFERLFILEAEDEDETVTGLEAEVGHGRELLAEGATGVLHHQLAPAPRAKMNLVVVVVLAVVTVTVTVTVTMLLIIMDVLTMT